MSPARHWEILGGRVLTPAPFCIFGVVNVTPDSFSDGGRYESPQAAAWRIVQMVERSQGLPPMPPVPVVADIGGESTRPYAAQVSAQEEMARVLPVLSLARSLPEDQRPAALSVDTNKAAVAAAAIEAGAEIINDISAASFDPELMDVLAQHKPGYVLMHCQGRPQDMQNAPTYEDVVDEVLAFFEAKLAALAKAGLPEQRVLLDPGIGFGKTLEHNLTLLRSIERLTALGRPLMVGLSYKSVWGKLLGLSTDERGNATQAATAVLAARGVAFHRVHDVALTAQTLRVVESLRQAAE